MIQLLTDNWGLIAVVILFAFFTAAYLHTDHPESNKDMYNLTDEAEEIYRQRKEKRIGSKDL